METMQTDRMCRWRIFSRNREYRSYDCNSTANKTREAAPSTNITLPHHALVAASDPSIQPLGPDPEPSSEATTDILINEHLPPSDDAALTELAPLNGE